MTSIIKNLVEYIGIDFFSDMTTTSTALIYKEFLVQEHIKLNDCMPDIEQITRVTTHVEITNTYEIKTPLTIAPSPGGQRLTGRKLIIEGIICQTIQYVADNCEQTLHTIENEHCFSTFAVLEPLTTKTSYAVIPYVEDVSTDQIGERDILNCVTLFLEVR